MDIRLSRWAVLGQISNKLFNKGTVLKIKRTKKSEILKECGTLDHGSFNTPSKREFSFRKLKQRQACLSVSILSLFTWPENNTIATGLGPILGSQRTKPYARFAPNRKSRQVLIFDKHLNGRFQHD